MAGLELFSIDLPFTQWYILIYGWEIKMPISNNYQLNGTGTFAEAGFAMNYLPFLLIILGGRYEVVAYNQYKIKNRRNSR
jgi:hypothetical protein